MDGTTRFNRTDGDHSVGELVQQLSQQTSTLIRQEMRLATAELQEKGKHAGRGAGMFGGAGLVALYGVGALIAAAIIGLGTVLELWIAAVIVGVVLLAVAGILGLDEPRNPEGRPAQSASRSNMPSATALQPQALPEGRPDVLVASGRSQRRHARVRRVLPAGSRTAASGRCKKAVTDAVLAWDTTTVPNGRYIIKVTASDAPSNPAGARLSGDKESAPFDVDNTPPTVTVTAWPRIRPARAGHGQGRQQHGAQDRVLRGRRQVAGSAPHRRHQRQRWRRGTSSRSASSRGPGPARGGGARVRSPRQPVHRRAIAGPNSSRAARTRPRDDARCRPRAGALGDVLLLRPAVAALRAAGHAVSLLAPSGPAAALLGGGPCEVDSVCRGKRRSSPVSSRATPPSLPSCAAHSRLSRP